MNKFLCALIFVLSQNLMAAHTVTDVVSFCESWFPALVRGTRDSELAAKNLLHNFYSRDAILIDPNFQFPQKGTEALKRYYQTVLHKYPNWSFDIEEIFITKNGFVLHYLGHVPGVVNSFRGVDIIEIDSQTILKGPKYWKISKLVGIYDRKPFM